MNKNTLIVILIVIVLAVLGALIFSQVNSNVDTQINFISPTALNNGENVTFELKDAQGNALANENINIEYVNDGQSQNFTITTDNQGRGYLTIENEESGTRQVTVSFAGHDKYNPCNATQTITIGDATSDVSTSPDTSQNSQSTSTQPSSSDNSSSSSSSSSSSNSELNYDSDLNVYYDNNGVIKGGQNDGESYDYIKNNPPEVDENGNLN
jgi:uncharacterized protein YxeA